MLITMLLVPVGLMAKSGSVVQRKAAPMQSMHAAAVSAGVVWNQGSVDVANSDDISGEVTANDFTLSDPATLTSLDAWLTDDTVNDNGVLDDFSGTLGWAIYADAGDVPGTLLYSGQDASAQVTDTGLQDDFDCDIGLVHATLGAGIQLQPGTYWLALHEGAWGSAADGSTLWWQWSDSRIGAANIADTDEESPGTWDDPLAGEPDNAFILYGALESVPAVSPVGMAVFVLLLASAGALTLRRIG